MNTKIHLDANMVPATLRGSYKGKKFAVVICTETVIPADAGLWSGGTRDYYRAVDMATGEAAGAPRQDGSPWDGDRTDFLVILKPGVAIVRHSIFSGKDMGLTFYVHPDNAAKLLPVAPAAELTAHEKLVLQATCCFKASYNGKDRYDMMKQDMSCGREDKIPSRAQWDAAKQALIAKGLLNKAGAVTPAGRNARPPRY